MFIIIKTSKNMESTIESVHKTKEDASHRLTQLSEESLINTIIHNNILKVYENNWLFRNRSLHLYQVLEVKEGDENKYGTYSE